MKKQISMYLEEDSIKEFKKICIDKNMTLSRGLQSLLDKYLKERKWKD